MCARPGCGCDAAGLDALAGRLWVTRVPEWCPSCGNREVGDGLTVCVLCQAARHD